MLKLATCVAIVGFGIPFAYQMIPAEVRPANIWDFANSVLLFYLATIVSITALAGNGSNDEG